MSKTVHVFDYLDAPARFQPAPVCVLFGDESFLKKLALNQLRRSVAGGAEEEPPLATFSSAAEWRDVIDELSTASLFGGARRLAHLEQADEFVTRHRARLEDYAARPRRSGVLVLDVRLWPSNTRLYKLADQSGLQIECRPPEQTRGKRKTLDEARVHKWLAAWAKNRHNAALQPAAAQLLLELVGPRFGLLDQDLAKLALFAGLGGAITSEMVRDVVGGWRAKTIWELTDAAVEGRAADALQQLDRLLQSGENPLALLAQISWSLRRFAAATRLVEQTEREGRRVALPAILEQAGFRKWPREAMDAAQRQLLQLGRERGGQLYQWLLEADLALKGSHSATERARLVLELLLVRLSQELSPRRGRRLG